MNEDLKWLAANVQEWNLRGRLKICAHKHVDGSFFASWVYPDDSSGYTRAQWQAARDELGLNHSVDATEKVWRGSEDGLPPVGTTCICSYYSFGIKTIKATIRAYFEDRVWVDVDETYLDGKVVTKVDAGIGKILVIKETDFTPLPTEEDKAVEDMVEVIINHYGYPKGAEGYSRLAKSLYHAGLRFTE